MQCQHCRKEIGYGEPIYRLQLWDGHPWVPLIHATVIRHFCADCSTCEPWIQGCKWHSSRPCHSCGRPVFHGARRGVPRHVSCSPECRRAVYAARAREQRRKGERPCQTCGKPFQPKRTDALTCSDACRQRAYRQRQHAEAA